MEYNQIGGRAKIVPVLGDHLLKPTSEYEIKSYLNLPRVIADLAPQCCFIVSKGTIIPMRKCDECETQATISTVRALIDHEPEGFFLLMKDAAHGIKKPRLLDLKLGTRTYSDHISEEKQNSRIRKSQQSTTSLLGIRLCGASFFGKDEGEKVSWTKATGKAMSGNDLVTAMKEFFDIPETQKASTIRQLEKIKCAIETCPSKRFFGSSLLVLIDDDNHAVAKVKLIDFANMSRSERNQVQYEGADTGALFGLNNLIHILNNTNLLMS